MAKRGALPSFRVGGHVRFMASEIVKWSSEWSEEKRATKTAGIEADEYLSASAAHTFEQRLPKERP